MRKFLTGLRKGNMKTKQLITVVVAGLMLAGLGCAKESPETSAKESPEMSAKEAPKMKMTTEIPEGLTTPDKLETHLGTLTSFDGVPDKATTQLVYDNLDLQRATQAFLSTLQISSLNAMEKGLLGFGPSQHHRFTL